MPGNRVYAVFNNVVMLKEFSAAVAIWIAGPLLLIQVNVNFSMDVELNNLSNVR